MGLDSPIDILTDDKSLVNIGVFKRVLKLLDDQQIHWCYQNFPW